MIKCEDCMLKCEDIKINSGYEKYKIRIYVCNGITSNIKV